MLLDHFEHIVITRFCIRGYNKYVRKFGRQSSFMKKDPLDPLNLKQRHVLIENIAFPSLTNQISQNFKWIILIDPELPQDSRSRLEKLTAVSNIFLHEFRDELEIEYWSWLKEYIHPECKYLITSHLDDDDAYHENFVAQMQTQYLESFINEEADIRLFGSTRVVQWDMLLKGRESYGFKSSWHRDRFSAVSCGYTCISRIPQVPLYILSFMHSWAQFYFDHAFKAETSGTANIRWVREQLKKVITFEDETGFDNVNTFVDTSDHIEAPLMTNHFFNLQPRLIEKKENRSRVKLFDDFAGHHVNWIGIEKSRSLFRPTNDNYYIPLLKFKVKCLERHVKRLFGI